MKKYYKGSKYYKLIVPKSNTILIGISFFLVSVNILLFILCGVWESSEINGYLVALFIVFLCMIPISMTDNRPNMRSKAIVFVDACYPFVVSLIISARFFVWWIIVLSVLETLCVITIALVTQRRLKAKKQNEKLII